MAYKQRSRAFTLVESVIVLMITTLVISLSITNQPKESSSKQVNRFLEHYQQFWNVAESHALSRQNTTYFEISSQQIRIYSDDFEKVMKCPKNIQVDLTTITIKEDGYVAPQTINFNLDGQVFSIIYSMAGGNYRVEKG